MPGPALTSDMQTSTAEYATIVNEIVAAASEFVEAMLKEEHVNAKPNESNNILKTKLLSRWALKFKSMQDPANVSKVNQELHVLNDNVGVYQSFVSRSGTGTTIENELPPARSENPATVQFTMLELWRLDLIAASVARTTLDEDLKELVVVPPKFAENLTTTIAHANLRIKFPLVKVVGDVIMKETKASTEMVNQAEMDEYLTGQFTRVAMKLVGQMNGLL